MDDFVVGVLAGILLGILFRRSRRVVDEGADEALSWSEPPPPLVNEEEYEDPGKVERQMRLEQYRRLLREEFGVDQVGSLVEPMSGEEAGAHG